MLFIIARERDRTGASNKTRRSLGGRDGGGGFLGRLGLPGIHLCSFSGFRR